MTEYRMASSTRSVAEIEASASFLIENFPIQSDQVAGHEWRSPVDGSDQVASVGELVTSMDGHQFGYGGAELTWVLPALSPQMVNYIWTTIFQSKYSNAITIKTRNRKGGEFEVYNVVALWKLETEQEGEVGGYRLTIPMHSGTLASAGPTLSNSTTFDGSALVVDQDGAYDITISNTGSSATFDPVTVVATLPSNVDYVSNVATGWTVDYSDDGITYAGAPTASTAYVRFTRSDVLDSGNSYPVISIGVTATATGIATLSTTGSTTGSANATNSDAVNVGDIDLSIAKSHVGNFTASANETWTIDIESLGSGDTVGATRVVDEMPAGFVFVSTTEPVGWDVDYSDDGVTYSGTSSGSTVFIRWTLSTPFANAETAQFTLTATAPAGAGNYDNTATVTATYDQNPANDSAVDTTTVV